MHLLKRSSTKIFVVVFASLALMACEVSTKSDAETEAHTGEAKGQGGATQDELGDILKRLDDENPAARDKAQKDLATLCRNKGPRFIPDLEKRIGSKSPEVRARVQVELEFLEKLRSYQDFLDVYAKLEVPSVQGKRWVLFNTGKFRRDTWGTLIWTYNKGWIISLSDEEISLLRPDAITATQYSRNTKLPALWLKQKKHHPQGMPLPGNFVTLDFSAHCAEFLTKQKDVHAAGSHDFIAREAAELAYWALQQGQHDTAHALMECVVSRLSDKETPDLWSARDNLVGALAVALRATAIVAADNDKPRTEILKQWLRLSEALPTHEYIKESKRMVTLYSSMIEEDKAFSFKNPDAVKRLPESDQAAYWRHQLRDFSAKQLGEPGVIFILGPLAKEGTPENPNPAQKLYDLGWDALPELMDHLDDDRPTRSMEYSRSWFPSTFHLMTVGQCCQEIFAALTSVSGSDQARAREWWQKARDAGPEAFYMKHLQKAPTSLVSDLRAKAAHELLKMDAGRYQSKVMDEILAAPWDSNELLERLIPYLTQDDRPFLRKVKKQDNLETAFLASKTLWELFEDLSGPDELIIRIKSLTLPHRQDPRLAALVDRMIRFLKAVPRDHVKKVLPELRRKAAAIKKP